MHKVIKQISGILILIATGTFATGCSQKAEKTNRRGDSDAGEAPTFTAKASLADESGNERSLSPGFGLVDGWSLTVTGPSGELLIDGGTQVDDQATWRAFFDNPPGQLTGTLRSEDGDELDASVNFGTADYDYFSPITRSLFAKFSFTRTGREINVTTGGGNVYIYKAGSIEFSTELNDQFCSFEVGLDLGDGYVSESLQTFTIEGESYCSVLEGPCDCSDVTIGNGFNGAVAANGPFKVHGPHPGDADEVTYSGVIYVGGETVEYSGSAPVIREESYSASVD